MAARTGGPGMEGITLFLVHRSTEGFQTRPIHCQGNIGSGTAFIVMENVTVPATHIIGQENKGFKSIMFNFNHERLGIITASLRYARVCFEEALTYGNQFKGLIEAAKKRKTFGKYLFERMFYYY